MKKIFFILVFALLTVSQSTSQVLFDSRIDSAVNQISQERIKKYMRELTGDTVAIIGGVPRLIFSRYASSYGNELAGQYILEKFQSFGLISYLQVIDSTCKNVIAVKQGSKYPNQMYIIGAHYDNIIWPINPSPFDTVHGADDNCSGVCGVLEAARILSGINTEYTVVFAAWDQEENSQVWGAGNYVDSALARNDSIRGYINMDMLAWNDGGTNRFWAGPDSNSVFFQSIFSSISGRYLPSYKQIYYRSENYGSDQLAFLWKGYHVFNIAEYNVNSNPNYHKITDNFANANIPYLAALLRPAIGMLTAFALNKTAYFSHKPLANTMDTVARTATVVIKMPMKTSTGNNAPRLYYKINKETQYSHTGAYYTSSDTFKFIIPSYPPGTYVKYYFAAQDTIENFVCTYPGGGSGLNPPGTVAPPTYFSYQIYSDYNQCSATLPKPINDLQMLKDTILVNFPGYVAKLKINLSLNHQNDGDLILQVQIPGVAATNLSQRNGQGGQNYINTTFDDEAAIPITQGTPPFTGTYKPQSSLASFNGLPLTNTWVLRITDVAAGSTGTLTNWCLLFRVRSTVNIEEEEIPSGFELSQNYPNPFNSSTSISYSIPKNTEVSLKIFDLLGREVRTLTNEYHFAGKYAVVFNAGNLASGLYFYVLKAANNTSVRKMVIIK